MGLQAHLIIFISLPQCLQINGSTSRIFLIHSRHINGGIRLVLHGGCRLFVHLLFNQELEQPDPVSSGPHAFG